MKDKLLMEACPSDVDYFPKYYVSQPPHRDKLGPAYYKVVDADGPVFWRNEGDGSGKQVSFYHFMMEEKHGFGVNELNKEYTPWAEDGNQDSS